MARLGGGIDRTGLSPRARRIGGWLAAVLLLLVVAAAVRLAGGDADGPGPPPGSSATATSSPLPITFGTELGVDRLVVSSTRTDRFTDEDTFAYSVDAAAPATTVYVSVWRIAGGPFELVQAPDGAQDLPDAPARIGFRVPASALFAAFGPGTYQMFIHLEADGPPIATGTFRLIGPPSDGGTPPPSP